MKNYNNLSKMTKFGEETNQKYYFVLYYSWNSVDKDPKSNNTATTTIKK